MGVKAVTPAVTGRHSGHPVNSRSKWGRRVIRLWAGTYKHPVTTVTGQSQAVSGHTPYKGVTVPDQPPLERGVADRIARGGPGGEPGHNGT